MLGKKPSKQTTVEENINELSLTDESEIETYTEDFGPEYTDDVYKPVNQLYIPEEAKNKFRASGFDLQWVRIFVPDTQGQLDLKNIQKKEGDFYEFVERSEISGLTKTMTSFFGEDVAQGSHGLYVVGDLALAKFPIKRKEQKRQYLEKRTRSRSKAIIDDLRKNNLAPDKQHGDKFETVREQPRNTPSRGDVEFGA